MKDYMKKYRKRNPDYQFEDKIASRMRMRQRRKRFSKLGDSPISNTITEENTLRERADSLSKKIVKHNPNLNENEFKTEETILELMKTIQQFDSEPNYEFFLRYVAEYYWKIKNARTLPIQKLVQQFEPKYLRATERYFEIYLKGRI